MTQTRKPLVRLHINQHVIRANGKTGAMDPVITVKTARENRYAHEAIIRDDRGNEVARVVYRPDRPLSCGAKVWIECRADVELVVRDIASENPDGAVEPSGPPPTSACASASG